MVNEKKPMPKPMDHCRPYILESEFNQQNSPFNIKMNNSRVDAVRVCLIAGPRFDLSAATAFVSTSTTQSLVA